MGEKNEQLIIHPSWRWVILKCQRKHRFGEITLKIQDGVPICILSGIVREDPRDGDDDDE